MSCFEKHANVFLILLNVVLVLHGGVMLGFGITAKVSPESIGKLFDALSEEEQGYLEDVGADITPILTSNALFMIIVGAVELVIVIFGFAAACLMIKWMLCAYMITMLVMILADVALIIFASVYNKDFAGDMKDDVYKTVKEEFNEGLSESGGQVTFPTETVNLAWTNLQLQGKCCGANGYSDYENRSLSKNPTVKVPLSCCKLNEGIEKPTKLVDFKDAPRCIAATADAINDKVINDKGCLDVYEDKVKDFMDQNKGLAVGLAAGAIGLEFLIILYTSFLYKRVDKGDYSV